MEYCHFILMLWVLVNVSIIQICSSCFSEERQALLDFKASINETEYPHLILPSWIDHHEEEGYNNDGPVTTDCCNWEGVNCGDATGRILELHLRDLAENIYENYGYYKYDRHWFLNLSILLPLENLRALDLSDNYFGSSRLGPCERLVNFKNLEYLNLDGNKLGNAFQCLSTISSLKYLSLADNGMSSLEAPCERLANFKSLESLNLDGNNLDNTTFQCLATISSLQDLSLARNFGGNPLEGCERLSSFKNLKSLNLDTNFLEDSTIQCITTISSLKSLSLAWNNFQGLFPVTEINRLKQLEHLDLNHNSFQGSLSFKDLNLPHLQLLNLQYIYTLELSAIEVMTSLKDLTLSYNNISDLSILQGICRLKNLLQLDLSSNLFRGNIPPCLSNLTSLRRLVISNNNFSGNIPSFFVTDIPHLEYLSLSGNHFEGSFSLSSFFANHLKLQVFKLRNLGSNLYVKTEGLALSPSFQLRLLRLAGCNLNNETRRIPSLLFYQKELRVLDLSSNNLVGKFPNWLLENNTLLEFLDLQNNSFTGPFLSNATPKLLHLQTLDISNNEIDGRVPQDIGLLFPRLFLLNLSRNNFEGSIPKSLGNLKGAVAIDLSHNNFSGQVPDQIGTGCVNLYTLVLSNNSLRGYFPSSSANLTVLQILYMDNNHFSGSISYGLSRSPLLFVLDISNNEFQGKIPRWIGDFSSLNFLDLSRNQLEDTIPDDICKLLDLQFLGLSENRLNGSIPSCFGFPSLEFIHLQRNQVTGSIPNALLKNSPSLKALDLRYNHISGGIPSDIRLLAQLRVLLLGGNDLQGQITASICQLKVLNILDLSQNNFSGQIPSCLSNISFGANLIYDTWNYQSKALAGFATTYPPPLSDYIDVTVYLDFETNEIVQFRTKSMTYSYAGNILNNMSGLDLSENQLTGRIPAELGNLSDIRALNLSHNYLEGSIPSELSVLYNIESLDLSYNNLSGQIPFELTNLNFLSKFNVSYNNLSGRAPDKGQFANFDESNYRGNPNLCGPLLQRYCENITGMVDPTHGVGGEDNDGTNYVVEFFLSFLASFVVALVTFALTLYLYPQYRRAWSNFIDTWILSKFYQRFKFHSK